MQAFHSDGRKNYPDYTPDFPAAVYEAGKRYCIAWAMKNHAAAGCMANGGSDDTRLYYHPAKADGSDPKISEFKKYNIRGNCC